jgi:hypothetical protein
MVRSSGGRTTPPPLTRQAQWRGRGEIVAHPSCGLLMGNRVLLHTSGNQIVMPDPYK